MSTNDGWPINKLLIGLYLLAGISFIGRADADVFSDDSASSYSLDLSTPFRTTSAFQFNATQGPPVEDEAIGDKVPGVIKICLYKKLSGSCESSLLQKLNASPSDDMFSEPHFLNAVQVVHPRGVTGRALLIVSTASIYSGDGDQLVMTQVLSYDRTADRFVRIYDHTTGRNNNEEVRYIGVGPLEGDIVSVEPTDDAPYGFWVSVNTLTPSFTYKEVLRYRSATTYADGNPLSVIDSEMPNIQRRLGLWRPGMPLPLPATSCPKPHMIGMELWCH